MSNYQELETITLFDAGRITYSIMGSSREVSLSNVSGQTTTVDSLSAVLDGPILHLRLEQSGRSKEIIYHGHFFAILKASTPIPIQAQQDNQQNAEDTLERSLRELDLRATDESA